MTYKQATNLLNCVVILKFVNSANFRITTLAL